MNKRVQIEAGNSISISPSRSAQAKNMLGAMSWTAKSIELQRMAVLQLIRAKPRETPCQQSGRQKTAAIGQFVDFGEPYFKFEANEAILIGFNY